MIAAQARPHASVPAVPVRVMLCDDSAVIRAVLARMLSSEPGIEVVARVADGAQAIAALTPGAVDVVILDIEMPVMDGLAALLVVILGTGLLVCGWLGCHNEPFLALVVGFVLLSHALLLGNVVLPGTHIAVVAAFAPFAALGLLRRPPVVLWTPLWTALGIATCVALFTAAWNIDVAGRLAQFRTTGVMNFWLDVFVHAGTIGQFAAPQMVGHGMASMADSAFQLYHFASYMPAALLVSTTGTPLLDATLLAWIPLGVLIMAVGVAALGLALGGERLALAALAALAVLPNPEQLAFGNGFLGFAWLLETGPGTPYSLGVACGALAALIHWIRMQNPRGLLLAFGLAAGCVLVRFNTAIWLAPLVGLGALAGWRRLKPGLRIGLVLLGLTGLAAALVALSWPALRANATEFVFSYSESIHTLHGPNAFTEDYDWLMGRFGHAGVGAIGIPLILFGTLGPWLPAFILLAFWTWRRRMLCAEDALPAILLAVATLASLLAPVARNGDVTEFRHRALPLLVVVVSLWCLRWAGLLLAPLTARLPRSSPAAVLGIAVAAVLASAMLASSIGAAKRPRMAWGAQFYGTRTDTDLIAFAAQIAARSHPGSRFAVANQPPEARNIDDAAKLIALSAVPAYISNPAFLLASGGHLGDEARRRMEVLGRLAAAPTLTDLKAWMSDAGLDLYVVTTEHEATFDPQRRGAVARVGTYALYNIEPSP